ncbi:MAG: dephospho-CoA kinase [Armatimonadota bacterium]
MYSKNSEPVRFNGKERTGSFFCSAIVVGLTGGVATGKSTVAQMFSELGAQVVSADSIVHRMLGPGTDVYKAIVREFGEEILSDGRIDRRKLGETVFVDPAKRLRLEAITHPPVLHELRETAEKFRRTGRGVLVLEIPLLFEAECEAMVDKIVVVVAEQETQISRLEYRYGINREEALLRIKAQMSLDEKVRRADWVVRAEGSLSDTKKEVDRVWHLIQNSLAPRK